MEDLSLSLGLDSTFTLFLKAKCDLQNYYHDVLEKSREIKGSSSRHSPVMCLAWLVSQREEQLAPGVCGSCWSPSTPASLGKHDRELEGSEHACMTFC